MHIKLLLIVTGNTFKSSTEIHHEKTLIASLLGLGMAMSVQAKDIVDTAVAAGSFNTLATALGAAGLVDIRC